MSLSENIRLALRAIRANLLRAVLTLLIIAFGIMALVGILTAIDSAIYSLSNNLSTLGANTIDIDPNITYKQAMAFKDQYQFPALSSVSFSCTGSAVVKYNNEETNPNVLIFAIDENYLAAKGFELEVGRGITPREALTGGLVTIVGNDIVDQLFDGEPQKAIDQTISAGNIKLRVIGVLKERGSMQESEDRRILIPLQTGRRYFGSQNTDYNLLISINDPTQIDNAIAVATGVMRNVRSLKAAEDNDFEISKSDRLIDIIKENTLYLRMAAIGIGLITLLGAAIGLMNIMLVSVTERTREVGISKALGATSRSVLIQFLTESVVISMMGGLVGIVLGVAVGNLVTVFAGGNFIFPWGWIILAVITCTLVGLASGLYPAMRAAQLDPIESLRYE